MPPPQSCTIHCTRKNPFGNQTRLPQSLGLVGVRPVNKTVWVSVAGNLGRIALSLLGVLARTLTH